MSGQLCFEVLDKMFMPKNKQSIEEIKGYTIKYGNIVDNGEVIDEVLVSYFKAPKSYTMENMCEINSHGGNIIVKKILELCLKNGAELAEPGEFTKRAFLNGRIDLVQAESVIDIINAKSEKEVKTGIKQLEGLLSKEIAEIKQEIMDVMINIEVSIDYPEYDVEDVANAEITDMLDSVKKKLERLERSFDNDERLGFTGVGPHRDDIKITSNSVDIRKFGSQGQQRSAVLSLKLAEIKLHESQIGEKPILLLDDVLAELDVNRCNAFCSAIQGIQTIVASTDIPINLEGGRIFNIGKDKKIVRVK